MIWAAQRRVQALTFTTVFSLVIHYFSQCSRAAVWPDELECESWLTPAPNSSAHPSLSGEAVAPAVLGGGWCWLVEYLALKGGEMQRDVGAWRHWLAAVAAPRVPRQEGRAGFGRGLLRNRKQGSRCGGSVSAGAAATRRRNRHDTSISRLEFDRWCHSLGIS